MFTDATLWPLFQPVRSFTSQPNWWLKSQTRLVCAGSATLGRAWLRQKSHSNWRATCRACSDALALFNTCNKSFLDGWRRFVCKGVLIGLRSISFASSPARHSMQTGSESKSSQADTANGLPHAWRTLQDCLNKLGWILPCKGTDSD